MSQRPRIVAFDMIDTVSRLDALQPALESQGLAAGDVETLYAGMLRDAIALTAAGGYAPLPGVLDGALDQLRAKRGMGASESGRAAVRQAMQQLDPHPDAKECFRRLKEAGFRVHALSNGGRQATEALIDRAGFTDLFDGVHSVEAAKRYKPHRAAYMSAVEAMNAVPEEVMLVATHAWDCHGAKRVGMRAAFVSRGQEWPKRFDKPDVAAQVLVDISSSVLKS